MKSPAIIGECGNKYHDDNNVNEIDSNINDMNDSIGTCPEITSPSLMMEREGIKHTESLDNETETYLDILDCNY